MAHDGNLGYNPYGSPNPGNQGAGNQHAGNQGAGHNASGQPSGGFDPNGSAYGQPQSSPYATPYADLQQGYPQQDTYFVPNAPQPSYAPPQPQVVVNTYAPAPVYLQPQSTSLSNASMWLGIASFVFGWLFFAPVAGLIFGFMGLKREPAGRGRAIAGIVLNGVFVAFWVLLALMMFGVFASVAAVGSAPHVG